MAKAMTIDVDALQGLYNEIAEIDTKIGAASGNEAQVRKSIAAGFAVEHAANVDKIVADITAALNKVELPVVIGVMDKLDDVLQETFSGAADELLDERAKAATSGSKEDVVALRETRKQKNEMFKALRLLLEQQFSIDTTSVPDPKRGGGRPAGSGNSATPKRDGRNKEGYRYSIDGKERPASQNYFSSLAYHSTLGCEGDEQNPERWGVEQLRNFLTEQGVQWGSVEDGGQDTWEVKLPNSKVIAARRLTEDDFPKPVEEEDAEGTTEA